MGPYGTIPQRFQVLDHVIDHAVTKLAHGAPVCGIESFFVHEAFLEPWISEVFNLLKMHFEVHSEVLSQIPLTGCSLLLLDLHMPHVSGQEILKQVKIDFPEIPVIVITADEAVDTAVDCMKLGAFDYLTKPVERNRLWASVRHALEIVELQREVGSLSRRIKSGKLTNPEAFTEIITDSECMKSIFRYVEAVAASPKPILVTGESGTGKELIAKVIHSASLRRGPCF